MTDSARDGRRTLQRDCQVDGCTEATVAVVREGPLQGKRVCIGHLDDHGEAAGWWNHD